MPQGPSGEAPGLGALGLQDIPPSQAEAGVGSQTQAHLKDYGELCLAPSPAPSSTLCEIGREGGGRLSRGIMSHEKPPHSVPGLI